MSMERTDSVQDDPLEQPLFVGNKESVTALVDTSTLIYLDRIGLLDRALAVFSLSTIPQVILEFGHHPAGLALYEPVDGDDTDRALVQAAARVGAVILSEDRQLLKAARRRGLLYYNTLMLVTALFSRQELSRAHCEELLAELHSFARYSEQVREYGRQLFERLVRPGRSGG